MQRIPKIALLLSLLIMTACAVYLAYLAHERGAHQIQIIER